MKKIRLLLDYMCSPIWIRCDDDSVDTIEPSEMPISYSLVHDIEKWNRIYQSTLDQDYPPYSGFSSKEANDMLQRALQIEGRSIYLRLKEELGSDYDVSSPYADI